MPKTPGKKTRFKMHDPARVSHLPVRQSVRHPGGVAGLLAMPSPRVFGATPLDLWLRNEHPQGVVPIRRGRDGDRDAGRAGEEELVAGMEGEPGLRCPTHPTRPIRQRTPT